MPFLRSILVSALFGAFSAGTSAVGAEFGNASRMERPGQGVEDIGRRFDVTQLFDRRAPEPDEDMLEPSHDAAAASVRIDRLENQLRSLTGLVEQLQHDVRRLEDQLRRNREAAAGAPALQPQRNVAAAPEPTAAGAYPSSGPAPGGVRRGDAFDPSRDPNAVGAPRPLGTTPPSAPLAAIPSRAAAPAAPSSDLRSPGAPLDLTHGRLTDATTPTAPQIGALGPAPSAPQTPKDEYDAALAHLRQGQYEAAEKGFSGFLAKNPRSRLAPQATFNLGESFFLRERHREAAEKYLEISTKYPTSPQAPEAMLRLGQSLHAIGAKEQACASFSEIAAKYPGAPARVKEAAQRESKRVQC